MYPHTNICMFLYYFYSLITAPGVVVHELGHLIFCVFAGVKVHKVKLFQFGNPSGYVEHNEPDSFFQSVLVSFGPLIVNSILALVAFARFTPVWSNWRNIVLVWLAVAVGLHAIPSTGDAKSLFQTTNGRVLRNPLVIIGYPLVFLLYILNFLRAIHLDFVYVGFLYWLGHIYLK